MYPITINDALFQAISKLQTAGHTIALASGESTAEKSATTIIIHVWHAAEREYINEITVDHVRHHKARFDEFLAEALSCYAAGTIDRIIDDINGHLDKWCDEHFNNPEYSPLKYSPLKYRPL